VQFYVIRHQPRTCNFTLPLQALGPIGYDCIKRYWKYQIKIYYVHFLPIYRPCLSSYYATFQIKDIWLHWLQAFIGKQTFSSPPLVQRHHLGGKWVNVLHWHSVYNRPITNIFGLFPNFHCKDLKSHCNLSNIYEIY
jgi:hypothetical protein